MSFMNRIAVLAIAASTLFSASHSYAWGADGHRATGEIAWQLLDTSVQQKVLTILAAKGETSLAEAGTWADRMRGDASYDWAKPMHYINLPVAWEGYEKSRDCPQYGCIVEAIHIFREQLADTTRTDAERAEALLFLVHFVEDIHQPMHTGLREDRGGNDVKVTFYGKETNLHALWDTHLPGRFMDNWQSFATHQVDRIDRRQLFDLVNGEIGGPLDWLAESHRFAHSNAYSDTSVLGEDYYEENRAVAELRLRQGGMRLAVLLTEILGAQD
ncbi:S1/P1 nuclease [Microbulbifer agarilyticus]